MSEEISTDEVRKVARLARLTLDGQQLAAVRQDLADVLGYVSKLNEVDVTDVEPMAHPMDRTNRFDPDQPQPPLDVDAALANAPMTVDGLFAVPKVIDASAQEDSEHRP